MKPVVRSVAEEGQYRVDVLGVLRWVESTASLMQPEPLCRGGSMLPKSEMFYLLCHDVHQTWNSASF